MKLSSIFLFSALVCFSFFSCSEEADSSSSTSFTVSFDSNGGGDFSTQSVLLGNTADDPLITPSKTGYTFIGWYYTDSNGVEREYSFSIAVTQNITLRAKYSVNSYKIVFDDNNAYDNSGSLDSMTCNYDTEYTLPQNTFTNLSSSFLGWSRDPDASTPDYENGSSVKSLSSVNNDTVTLYAVWNNTNYYVINYELNGGSNNSSNVRRFYETSTVLLYDADREGYTFDGWYYNEDFSGNKVAGWLPGTNNEDITLYAKWEPQSCTVILNNQGSTSQVTVAYDDYLADISVPELTGATFGGYYSQPYGEGIMYINSAGKGVTKWSYTDENILYALWNYDITYDYSYIPSEVNCSNSNLSTYNGGRDVTLYALTLTSGWQFDNWIDETGTAVTKIEAGSSGKRTFSARVSMANYSITYNMNGGSWDTSDGGYTPLYTFKKTSDPIYLPSEKDILKDGYTFGGWYTEEDFSETSKITIIASGTCEDFVLWAKWTEATE